MIYRSLLLRKHIDLSRLLTVSDAYFLDRMGSGGWFVQFSLLFQLQDQPVIFTRDLARDTEMRFVYDNENQRDSHHELAYQDEDGNVTWHRGVLYDAVDQSLTPTTKRQIVAVVNLQREIDELIREWKACKALEQR